MKNISVCKIFAFAVIAVVSMCTTSAFSQADAFNRAALGSNWVATSGSLSISNHELVGTTGALGYLKPAAKMSAASALVILGGTDLEYGAVVVGNIGGGTDAFVKIQAQNGAGTFDHAAFYTGNNGTGDFFALTSPVPSPALLDVFYCPATKLVTMRITSAAGEQSYTYNYGTTFGYGAGAGTYGSIKLDNFISFVSGCNDAFGATPAALMPRDADLSQAK
ncbi:MAG: hypothetical protein WA477_09820 [Candidatus Sulfotelmatobacter sp.]